MRLSDNLQKARFVSRLNRFAAVMDVAGQEVMVHIANSGRLRELLKPENPMWLVPALNTENRKTKYDLALVELDGTFVSADARLPNVILREAIENQSLVDFAYYEFSRSEVTFGESRIDLLLRAKDGFCYVEAKSATLVHDGVAIFPDSPTQRGRKHLYSLMDVVSQGHRAAVVFVIQRMDAESLSPNRKSDPEFCDALLKASSQGVEIYAYTCKVNLRTIEIDKKVPVDLG